MSTAMMTIRDALLAGVQSSKLVRACSGLTCLVFAGLIAWTLIDPEKAPVGGPMHRDPPEGPAEADSGDLLSSLGSRALFEPAVPLATRRPAQQAVSQVLERLKLLAIPRIQGVPTAYIDIKGEGMKGYRVGEGVEDLFTVTRIDERSVELKIAGETVPLRLP